MKIYLNRVVWKTRYGHALGCCWQAWTTIYRKARAHGSGTTWVNNHICRMRTKIHVLTQECLLCTMIIIQVYTLIHSIVVEWTRMLLGRLRVTGIGCDAFFNGSDSSTGFLFKFWKHRYSRDANRNIYDMNDMSPCPKSRNKQARSVPQWKHNKTNRTNHFGSNLHRIRSRILMLTSHLSNRCHDRNSSFLRPEQLPVLGG